MGVGCGWVGCPYPPVHYGIVTLRNFFFMSFLSESILSHPKESNDHFLYDRWSVSVSPFTCVFRTSHRWTLHLLWRSLSTQSWRGQMSSWPWRICLRLISFYFATFRMNSILTLAVLMALGLAAEAVCPTENGVVLTRFSIDGCNNCWYVICGVLYFRCKFYAVTAVLFWSK